MILSDSSLHPAKWQTALLSWAILSLAIFANTVLYRKLPLLEGIVTFLHVLAFFAFVIVLWYDSPLVNHIQICSRADYIAPGLWRLEGARDPSSLNLKATAGRLLAWLALLD